MQVPPNRRLWAFFDRFGIEQATMHGRWKAHPLVMVDRPETFATTFTHPTNGIFLVIGSWHPPIADWLGHPLDVSLQTSPATLARLAGPLLAVDIPTNEQLDLTRPIPLPDAKAGRLLWVRGRN